MKLLSIGCGKEQVEVIKRAQEKGYYVIGIDGNEKAEGFKYANEYEVIDISKKDEVIKYAKRKSINGVLQVPIGKLLTTIGATNDVLGLIGISEKAAMACTDKYITNNILRENNINCSKQILIKSEEKYKIKELLKDIKFPCVIKPRDGSGSNGVRVISSEIEVDEMVKEHLTDNKYGDTLIEEFLLGKEYGVDFIVQNNKGYLVLVREKSMTDIPFRQEIGYVCPAILPNDIYDEIYDIIFKAVKALKINNTLVHADIMIYKNKVYIIEISGRPSGLFLSTKVVPLATGIDFIGKGIDIITNKFDFNIRNSNQDGNKFVVIKFWDLPEGIVKRIPSIDIFKDDIVSEYVLNIKVEDKISKVKKGKNLIDRGYIIFKSDCLEKIKNKEEEIEREFVIQREI